MAVKSCSSQQFPGRMLFLCISHFTRLAHVHRTGGIRITVLILFREVGGSINGGARVLVVGPRTGLAGEGGGKNLRILRLWVVGEVGLAAGASAAAGLAVSENSRLEFTLTYPCAGLAVSENSRLQFTLTYPCAGLAVSENSRLEFTLMYPCAGLAVSENSRLQFTLTYPCAGLAVSENSRL